MIYFDPPYGIKFGSNWQVTTSKRDLCINVQLDTAHLWEDSQGPPATSVPVKSTGTVTAAGGIIDNAGYLPPHARVDVVTLSFKTQGGLETQGTRTYLAPPGWKIVDYYYSAEKTGDTEPYKDSHTDTSITIELTPSEGKKADASVELHVTLIPAATDSSNNIIAGMFLIGRSLCCCIDTPPAKIQPSVTYQQDLTRVIGSLPTGSGFTSDVNIVNSRRVSTAIKDSMITSMQSAARSEVGEIPFTQSDIFYNKILNIAKFISPELSKTIATSPAIAPDVRDSILAYVGDVRVDDFINTDSYVLSRMMNISQQDVLQVKDQILRGLGPQPVAPPETSPLRKVIGVRVLSTYPNPSYPQVLYEMKDPKLMPAFQINDQPTIFEVDFSGTPDSGTVTISTFFVTQGGTPLAATIQQLTMTKFRLVLTAPLPAGGVYALTLKGTGAGPIKFGGKALDGDPIALPSGDGIAGGDFTAAFNVIANIPAPPAPPPVVTYLNVIGVRVRTSTPPSGGSDVLFEMIRPGGVIQLAAGSNPDILEVDFNIAPDAGTVSTSSFLASSPSGPITGTVSSVSGTRFRFVPTAAFPTAVLINIELVGNGASAIKSGGVNLDGDPINLPSGNGTPGTSFTFSIQVNP